MRVAQTMPSIETDAFVFGFSILSINSIHQVIPLAMKWHDFVNAVLILQRLRSRQHCVTFPFNSISWEMCDLCTSTAFVWMSVSLKIHEIVYWLYRVWAHTSPMGTTSVNRAINLLKLNTNSWLVDKISLRLFFFVTPFCIVSFWFVCWLLRATAIHRIARHKFVFIFF